MMEIGLKEIGIIAASMAGLWGMLKFIPMLFSDVKILRHQKSCRKEIDEKFENIHETINGIRDSTAIIKNDVAWIKRELNGGHGDQAP